MPDLPVRPEKPKAAKGKGKKPTNEAKATIRDYFIAHSVEDLKTKKRKITPEPVNSTISVAKKTRKSSIGFKPTEETSSGIDSVRGLAQNSLSDKENGHGIDKTGTQSALTGTLDLNGTEDERSAKKPTKKPRASKVEAASAKGKTTSGSSKKQQSELHESEFAKNTFNFSINLAQPDASFGATYPSISVGTTSQGSSIVFGSKNALNEAKIKSAKPTFKQHNPEKVAAAKAKNEKSAPPNPTTSASNSKPPAKKSDVVAGNASEVKKTTKAKVPQTEDAFHSVKGTVLKFLTPGTSMPQAPRYVAPPLFEYIEITQSHEIIQNRLVVREFVMRFEKTVKLTPKHISIINNPESEWTEVTYRQIILALMKLIQIDEAEYTDKIKELSKITDERFWPSVVAALKDDLEVSHLTEFEDHKPKLDLVVSLIKLTMQTSTLRGRLDEDTATLVQLERDTKEHIKAQKARWEMTKQDLQKQRLQANAEERTDVNAKWQAGLEDRNSKIAKLEADLWFKKRKLVPRMPPLGIDAKGNIYWLYAQREKNVEDWGRWIVVERFPALPHPSGAIPQSDLESSDSDIDPPTREEVSRRVWYAISTSEQAEALADWIGYQYELTKYKRDTAKPEVPGLVRKQLYAVAVDMSPAMKAHRKRDPEEAQKLFKVEKPEQIPPEELVTKESTEALTTAIRKTADVWRLWESGLEFGKLPI